MRVSAVQSPPPWSSRTTSDPSSSPPVTAMATRVPSTSAASPAATIHGVWERRRRRATSACQQLADAGDALDQVVVAEGVGEAGVAGGTEGLARDDGHPHLVQDHLGQLQ